MRKVTILITAVALAVAACGGGDGGCSGIADDGVELIQDAINDLDGLSLTDLSGIRFPPTTMSAGPRTSSAGAMRPVAPTKNWPDCSPTASRA